MLLDAARIRKRVKLESSIALATKQTSKRRHG
jgi:hypothetical protein